jgi:UDP-N-acetylglucosamine 2-epimerase (non-hydrolysing)
VTISAGTNRLVGVDPAAITEIPAQLHEFRAPAHPPKLWDGRAAERLAGVLARDLLGRGEPVLRASAPASA